MKKQRFFIVAMFLQAALLGQEKQSVEESTLYLAPAWEYGVSHFGNATKQSGSLWGATMGYSYIEKNSVYFNVEFTGMAGRWTGSAGSDPTQEYITEARFGYVGTPGCEKFTLIPFIGIGSYVFNQTISPGSNFHSYFWYVPIGVALEYQVNASFSMGLIGIGAPTFSGFYKITHRRHAPTRALWKAELPITYLGSLPFSCSLIPFVKEWAYLKHDDLIKQQNMYYGLKVAFGYRF